MNAGIITIMTTENNVCGSCTIYCPQEKFSMELQIYKTVILSERLSSDKQPFCNTSIPQTRIAVGSVQLVKCMAVVAH